MLARNIHDEDTIELQLSATELELLNQAAAEAENEAGGKVAAGAHACAPSEQAAAKPEIATVAAAAETPPAPVVPAAFPERTARVPPPPAAAEPAPARSTERARGSLQLVPVAPAPAPTPRAPRRPVDLRPLARGMTGLRAFARHHFGVRAAAAVALIALIVIVFWPRTPVPEPAATPSNTTPTPTVVQPPRAPLPQALQPAAAAAAAAGTVVPPLAPPAPLRFRNPFDASEVFEFPAGTSYVEARDQVAQLLITRARSRNELHDASTSTAPANPSRTANEASLARQL